MLASLPPVLKRKISEFCHADEVLSLSSTCRTIHRDLSISVLTSTPPFEVFYSQLYAGISAATPASDPIQQGAAIPTFFARHCHSVRLTWIFGLSGIQTHPWRLYIVARPKPQQQLPNYDTTTKTNNRQETHKPLGIHPNGWIQDVQGNRGAIVWQSPPLDPDFAQSHNSAIDTIFRCDPTQNYFLWYQCEGGAGNFLLIEKLRVDRLLVWEDDTRHHCRKQTYAQCMEWHHQIEEAREEEVRVVETRHGNVQYHHFHCPPGHQLPACSMLAKLFSLALETIDLEANFSSGEESSAYFWQPIKTFLEPFEEGGADGIELYRGRLQATKHAANIYLRLMESPEGHQLSVANENNESNAKVFERFMGILLGTDEYTDSNESFHLGLLKAVGETLTRYKKSSSAKSPPRSQRLSALAELLASEGFSTEIQGLECLVELIGEMLRYRRQDLEHQNQPWLEPGGEEGSERLMFRTHAAM